MAGDDCAGWTFDMVDMEMISREELLTKLQLCVDDPMWPDHVEMPKQLIRIVIEQLTRHAQRAQRTNLLIQQLAWYYRVNDCAERHEDDAIEVPILDLRVAYEIARDLGLPDGPAALTSTSGVAAAQCAPSRDEMVERAKAAAWKLDLPLTEEEIRAILSAVTSTECGGGK